MHKRWWERLEQFNRVPVDEKRRWLIHTLLNIPPAYLGLQSLEIKDLERVLSLPVPSHPPALNIDTYKEHLPAFWQNPYAHFDEVLSRIQALQEYLLYRDQSDSTARVLCEYLIVAANMQRAQGYLTSAEGYAQKAINLAEERQFPAQQAKALYIEAYIQREKWRLYNGQKRKDVEQALPRAEKTLAQALTLVEHYAVHPKIESGIRFMFASCLSYMPTQKKKYISRQQYERARTIIDRHEHETTPLFLNIDKSWYTLALAQMHLQYGEPQQALSSLNDMPQVKPKMRRAITRKRQKAAGFSQGDGWRRKPAAAGRPPSLDRRQSLCENTRR